MSLSFQLMVYNRDMLKVITNIVGFITVASVLVIIIQVPALLLFFGVIFGVMYLINPDT